jgi:hypothetical protein
LDDRLEGDLEGDDLLRFGVLTLKRKTSESVAQVEVRQLAYPKRSAS